MSEQRPKRFEGRIHHPPMSNATVLWDLLRACNFGCSYCYSERLTLRPREDRSRSVSERLAAFADLLPGWNVNLSGGEPMLDRDFVQIAGGLSAQGNRVGLYTNLSQTGRVKEFCEAVDPAGIEFVNAAVHAEQRRATDPELRQFAEDFTRMRDAGFPIHASYIIHPENMHRVVEDIDRLEDLAVQVRIQVFRGVYNGATYPAAFSQEDIDLISPWEAGLDRGREVRMDFTGQGGSCMAGAIFLEMDSNGDCWRCGSYRSMRREPLGNLFERTLSLNPAPERCRMWACLSCRQGHAFHLDGLRDLFPG